MNRIWTKCTALLVAIFIVAMFALAVVPDQANAYKGDNNDYRGYNNNKHRDNGRHCGWDKKRTVVQPGYYHQRAYYPPPVHYPPAPPAVIVSPPYPNFNIVIPLGR